MSDFYNKYPYTDFHELNLDWVIERVKKLTEDWLATHKEWVGVQQDWADTEQAWIDFKAYVENYLANLDVQDEIDHKIDQMVSDGSLRTLIQPDVIAETISTTTDWLAANITQPTTPAVDASLSIPGAAADAAVTGKIRDALYSGYSDDIITATNRANLLNINPLYNGTFASSGSNYVITFPVEADTLYRLNTTLHTANMYVATLSTTPAPGSSYTSIKKWDSAEDTVIIKTGNSDTYIVVGTWNSNDDGGVDRPSFYAGLTCHKIVAREITDLMDAGYSDTVNTILSNHGPNVFDAAVFHDINGNISAPNMIINSSSSNFGVIFTCSPDKHYIITIGFANLTVFGAATTSVMPVANAALNKKIIATGQTSLQINTEASDSYIFIQCYNSSTDTGYTLKQIVESIRIYEKLTEDDVIYGGPNTNYPKLTDLLSYSMTVHDKTFIIKAGTYDLITELGSTYFDNFLRQDGGPGVGNRNTYIFEPGAVITANYTGANDTVKKWFAPLNIKGPCIVKGANISCSNCRYAIHNDPAVFNSDNAENIIIDGCELYIDNSANSGWETNICIGSGLTQSEILEIRNCILDAAVQANGGIGVHNSGSSGAKGIVIIKDNVMLGADQTVHIQCDGTTTEITNCIISNNALRQDVLKTIGVHPDNMNVIKFNNSIS